MHICCFLGTGCYIILRLELHTVHSRPIGLLIDFCTLGAPHSACTHRCSVLKLGSLSSLWWAQLRGCPPKYLCLSTVLQALSAPGTSISPGWGAAMNIRPQASIWCLMTGAFTPSPARHGWHWPLRMSSLRSPVRSPTRPSKNPCKWPWISPKFSEVSEQCSRVGLGLCWQHGLMGFLPKALFYIWGVEISHCHSWTCVYRLKTSSRGQPSGLEPQLCHFTSYRILGTCLNYFVSQFPWKMGIKLETDFAGFL